MRGHGADDQKVILDADAAQIGHARKIDDIGGLTQALLEGRNERLPTGEIYGILAARKDFPSLGERRGAVVSEVMNVYTIAFAPARIAVTMG